MTRVRQTPEQMGALVRDVFRAMVERIGLEFEDTDIVLSQWLTLKLMRAGAIACVGDVSRELGHESGSATRLVDQLEARGFVVRTRCRLDRRVVQIGLTEGGIAVIETMQPKLSRFWTSELGSFSPVEQQALFALLTRLRNGLLASFQDKQFASKRDRSSVSLDGGQKVNSPRSAG